MARSPNYYRCCCGVHVHTCTLIIAILGVVLNCLRLFQVLNGNKPEDSSGTAISLIAYIFLLIGNTTKKSIFYWVFLVLQIIALIVMTGLLIYASILLGKEAAKDHSSILGTALIIAFGAFLILVSFYFFYIVYRDYKFVRDEN